MKKLLTSILTLIFMMSMVNFVVAQEWAVPANYKSKTNPEKDKPESKTLGKTLYVKHCKSCHGATGKGDGAMASSLNTTIKSFATPAFKAIPDGSKYYMTFIGRGEMPGFKSKIAEEEDQWAIITYISSL